jgi:2-polyprenyl-3-methyl-5-hydroxy-6-metoxy-1,4-benzoquinol methylase
MFTSDRESYKTSYDDLTAERLDPSHIWLQGEHKVRAFDQWLEMVKRFSAEPLAESILLDVGCGTGGFLRFASSFVGECWGFDHSFAQVCYAKQNPMFHSRIYRALGVDEFRKESNVSKVDLVTLWDVLEHVHNPESFLRGIAELTSEGGLVFVSVPNVLFTRLKIAVWRLLFIEYPLEKIVPWEHVFYYSRPGLRSLFQRCGLEVIKCGPVRNYDRSPSIGEWVRRIYSNVTYFSPVLSSIAPQIFVLARRAR